MSRLWAMYDPEPRGVFPVRDHEHARDLNRLNHGIFATVQRFRGPRRKEFLDCIEAWAVDLDEGTKDEQAERILASPLVPSLVVETRNGFHVHFRAKGATEQRWPEIMEHRLIPFFRADRNAKDLARILRVPGYLHAKDPSSPYPVRAVHRWPVSYTEQQMLEAFPVDEAVIEAQERAEADAKKLRSEVRFSGDTNSDNFWQRAIELDCRHALERLSGHWLVGGEHFDFKRNASGTQNILVDKKSTSCWIDTAGRIGSSDKGGPSITRWCKWYGHSWRDIARGLREVFPELEGR